MNTKKIASTAIFTALTCVMTIVVRFPIAGGGYVNFGDTFIFITALCIGPFAGAFAGGVGSAIADVIGYPIYAPFTLVIKAIEGLVCGLIGMIITKKYFKKPIQAIIGTVGMFVASLVMVLGYFGTDWILSTLAGAVANLPFSVIQGGVSIVVAAFAVYGAQLRKVSERFGFVKPAKVLVISPPPLVEDASKYN